MYKVVKHFHDLQDEKKTKRGSIFHEYQVGDTYPRRGFQVSDGRLKELSGSDNKQGTPLIEFVKEKTNPGNSKASGEGTDSGNDKGSEKDEGSENDKGSEKVKRPEKDHITGKDGVKTSAE